MNHQATRWVRVTRHKPCPICERANWCGISSDGVAVRCMRVQSEKPAPSKDGEMGWIHKLTDPIPVYVAPRRQEPVANIDWEKILCGWRRKTTPYQIRELASGLGVSSDSLTRLGACYADERKAWAFPMSDQWFTVTGVRLRNTAARKWAVTGSKQGLFLPDMMSNRGSLVIVEGPTDAAAILGLGFDTIGRPSCSGGGNIIIEWLARGPSRDVVILSDRDEAKTRPDGSVFYPGQEGARALAVAVGCVARSVKVIRPLRGKDARAWVQSGATRVVVESAISNAYYWRPTHGS